MIAHGDLSTEEWELLFNALIEKSNRHYGCAKRIRNSGYGKCSTMEKADHHQDLGEDCDALIAKINDLIN